MFASMMSTFKAGNGKANGKGNGKGKNGKGPGVQPSGKARTQVCDACTSPNHTTANCPKKHLLWFESDANMAQVSSLLQEPLDGI